jgi:hypothetical protein
VLWEAFLIKPNDAEFKPEEETAPLARIQRMTKREDFMFR